MDIKDLDKVVPLHKQANKRPSLLSDGAFETEGKMLPTQGALQTNENNFEDSDPSEQIEGVEAQPLNRKRGVNKKQEAEDISESNEYFHKVRAIEILASFWAILQLGNSIIIYEVSYHNEDGEHDGFIQQSLAVSTLTSMGLTVSIILRHITHLKWKKSKLFCLKDETIWSSGYWKLMLVEALGSLVAPQYFFEGLEYKETNTDYDVKITYELNQILCCFVWVKCYVTVRTMLMLTKWVAPRSQRICRMNGCYADLMFAVRGSFKQSPNLTLISTIFVSGIICAYMLRVFERPLSEASGQNFNRIDTAMWNIIVTMTTVGYGDTFPKSNIGRALGIWICLWGVLLVSLFVVTISDALEFDITQKNAYNLIHRLMYREELKNEAAGAILSHYVVKINERKHKSIVDKSGNIEKVLENAKKNFKKRMMKFKEKENGIRKFDTATEVTYINNNLCTFLYSTIHESLEISASEMNKNANLLNMLTVLEKHQ